MSVYGGVHARTRARSTYTDTCACTQSLSPACQALGNLCVLTDYDMTTTACTLYANLRDRPDSNAGTGTGFGTDFNQNPQVHARAHAWPMPSLDR